MLALFAIAIVSSSSSIGQDHSVLNGHQDPRKQLRLFAFSTSDSDSSINNHSWQRRTQSDLET